MDEKPETFDWVAARAECSLSRAFQILREMVDSNVKTANRVRSPDATFELKAIQGDSPKFMVIRKRDLSGAAEFSNVTFELSDHAIQAKKSAGPHQADQKPILSATPSFTLDGECIFDVAGRSLKLWQISQIALEGLFFGK
jgi:hypothetical protein